MLYRKSIFVLMVKPSQNFKMAQEECLAIVSVLFNSQPMAMKDQIHYSLFDLLNYSVIPTLYSVVNQLLETISIVYTKKIYCDLML